MIASRSCMAILGSPIRASATVTGDSPRRTSPLTDSSVASSAYRRNWRQLRFRWSRRRIRSLSTLHQLPRAWADVFPYHLSRHFWEWIEEFQPDVIYSMLGSIRVMNLVLAVANRLNRPIVPHLMDDWPTTHYRESPFSVLPRLLLQSRLRAVLLRSPVAMGISELMAKEYQKRYGVRFDAFMNCVETLGEASRPARFPRAANSFCICGWLAPREVADPPGRRAGLAGPARGRLGRWGYRLRTRERHPTVCRAAVTRGPTMELGGSLEPDQVAEVLRRADVLIHVESFDASVRQYTRMSLSTKLPQYMASGRPILCYGPVGLASIRYIKDCECGIGVGEASPVALLSASRLLATSASKREQMGRRGWEVASGSDTTRTENVKGFGFSLSVPPTGAVTSSLTDQTPEGVSCDYPKNILNSTICV